MASEHTSDNDAGCTQVVGKKKLTAKWRIKAEQALLKIWAEPEWVVQNPRRIRAPDVLDAIDVDQDTIDAMPDADNAAYFHVYHVGSQMIYTPNAAALQSTAEYRQALILSGKVPAYIDTFMRAQADPRFMLPKPRPAGISEEQYLKGFLVGRYV